MSIYIQQPDKLQKLTGEKLTRSKIIAALGYTPSTFSGDYNDLTNKPITEDESNSSSLYVQDSSGNIIALIDEKGLTTTDLNAGGTLFSSFVDATEQAINNLDSIKANKSDVSESIDAVEDRIENITYDDIKGNPNLSDDGDYLEITDSNGNVLARFDSNGFTAASVITQQLSINGTDVTDAITGIEATLNDYDGRITINKDDIAENKTNIEANKSSIEALEEIVSPSGLQFNGSEFSIQDTGGNTILKVDESGLTTTNITSATTDNLQNQITTLANDIADVDQKADDINTNLSNHTSDTVKHITAAERSAWNAKATTNYVDTKVAGIVDTAPETLNTLNELAAALGDDPNFATTVANEIGTKASQTDLDAVEAEVDALQQLIDENGLTFNNNEFVIQDASGNTLAKFDSDGLTVASIVSPTIDSINTAISDVDDKTIENYNQIEAIKTQLGNKADASALTSHVNNTTIHVTSADKTNWSDKYTKSEIDTKVKSINDAATVLSGRVDSVENTVKTKANASDLEALGGRVEDAEEEIDALQGVIDENGLKFTKDEFVIEDSKGNTLAKFDASGLTVSAIVSPTITDVDNKAQGAADKADELENELTNYVKKETGKGLSQNDLTNTLKQSYDAAVSKLNGISNNANNVEASTTNGNIKIDGVEKTVYTLPSDVVFESDLNGYVTEDDLQDYAQYSDEIYTNNTNAPIAVAAANGVGPSNVKLSDLAKVNDLNGLLSDADVIDNLTTDNMLRPLSARQGKILDEKIKNISDIAAGAGNGDMLKSIFATQDAANGKVDHAIYSDTANIADNASKLNGQEANYYATANSVTTHTTNTSNPHGVTAAQVGAYTKGEIDNALTLKANTSALNDYAKAADLDSYVKSSDYQDAIDGINNELSGKATSSDLQNYVLNSTLNDYKTLVGSTYAKQESVDNAIGYFDETIAKYYSAKEVDTLLENIEIDVDSTLSSTSTNPVQNKVINAALQNYYTSVQVDNKLNDYVTTTVLNSKGYLTSASLNGYITTLDLNSALTSYVRLSDLNSYVTTTSFTTYQNTVSSTYATQTSLSNYYTKTEVNTKFNDYATNDHVDQHVASEIEDALLNYYTKTQVDGLISSSGGNFDPTILNGYLALSGGNMTGSLFFNQVAYISHNVADDVFRIDTQARGGMVIESNESKISIISDEEINLESGAEINVSSYDQITITSGAGMELQAVGDCDLSISNYNCTINLSADGGIQLDENVSAVLYKDGSGDNVAMQLDGNGLIVSSITTNQIYSPELEEIKQDINSLSLRSMGWRYVGEGSFNGVLSWTINTTENYQHKMALISLYSASMDMNIGTVTTPLNATTYCMHVFNPEVDVFGMMVVGIHTTNNSLSINIVHSSEEIGLDWFSDVVAKVYVMDII